MGGNQGLWGDQNKFEQKSRGVSRQIIIIFSYNLSPDYFFFKWEGKAGRGDDPGYLKKFWQGGKF